MRLRAFLPWSLLGTLVWTQSFTLVGYAFSTSFGAAAGALTHGALAVAVLAAVVLGARELLRARRATRVALDDVRPATSAAIRRVASC